VRYFDLCRTVAYKSFLLYRHGALLRKGKKILSLGWNCGKTHPRLKEFNHSSKYLHAEIHAILGLSFEELHGSTMYVVRLTAAGNLANSRPCVSCIEACRQVGISKVVYSMHAGKIGEIIL